MTDLVERLRRWYTFNNNPPSDELPAGAEVAMEAADEIERLRSVATAEMKLREGNFAEIEQLRARVAELEADSARLRVLAVEPFCDQYGDIDLHEQASIYASALGREEANDDDYMAALRDAIDVFRNAPMKLDGDSVPGAKAPTG